MSGPSIPIAARDPLLPIDKSVERPLWVVLIIMAFLAALALLCARMGERNYERLQTELAGSATVQLTQLTPQTRLDVAQQALTIIEQTAPNIGAERISDAEALSLIKPWIGSDTAQDLPQGIALPVLIALSGSTSAERENLRNALDGAQIAARIDDHSQWSGDIARAERAFVIGSWLVLLLIFFASTAASVFATQSAMSAQRKTVSVFAQVGAPDRFIIKLFVTRAVKIGAISGAIGAIAAALFLLIFRLLRGPSESGLLPSLSPVPGDFIMLIALCLVFGLVCAAAAGMAAKGMLQDTRLYA